MHRSYEIISILTPELPDDGEKGFIKKTEKIIKKFDGQVISVEEWGKKRLAYPIQKFMEGYYIQLNFTGSYEMVKEIERVLKLNEQVLRFQTIRIVKAEEKTEEETVEAEEEKIEEKVEEKVEETETKTEESLQGSAVEETNG